MGTAPPANSEQSEGIAQPVESSSTAAAWLASPHEE